LPKAPRVWDENPDNISHTYDRGDKAKTEAAFARAHHILRRRYVIGRVHAQYMEPRGAIGTYDAGEDRYTLYADVNYPHRVRNMLANMVFKVPESKVRVVCHDVGGGFGAKGWQYVEHRLTLWAAKKLGRPVKWSCERSEAILADEHGRDNIGEIELAFDDNAKILGLRLHMLASIGAYIASDRQLLTLFGMIGTVVGVYDIPAAYVSIDAVLSNTSPTAPYRGAGRPEAIYLRSKMPPANATSIRSSCGGATSFHPRRCLTRRHLGPITIVATSQRTWRRHSLRPTTQDLPRGARHRRSAGCCTASGSPTRSEPPPARFRNMPRSASTPVAPRCC
jgi:aerobic carbon-monoxide dehydrogenase large subunit